MKKKLMIITTIAMVIVLAATGTALAYNGNADGTGQRFASIEDYETVEEYHAAVLAQKLEIIDAKEADGSITTEEADQIRTHLTDCDGTCEIEGENPNRPEEGWGIFGQSMSGGQGLKGAGNRGQGSMSEDCDEDGVPMQDGSGSETSRGYKGGRNN